MRLGIEDITIFTVPYYQVWHRSSVLLSLAKRDPQQHVAGGLWLDEEPAPSATLVSGSTFRAITPTQPHIARHIASPIPPALRRASIS